MLTVIHEHYNGKEFKVEYDFKESLSFEQDYFYQFSKQTKKEKLDCFRIFSDKDSQKHFIANSYFVGVDWIVEKQKAIYVQPKLNKEAKHQTDYLKMLFTALQCPDVANHTSDLFEIKWDKPEIVIEQQQDLLTPLLVVQFLSLVKTMVRKGLKKSYYKVEQNLNSKVKGKVLVGQTIKKNLLNNKPLNTYCSYDEFGQDGLENRLLKKALLFVQRYLPTHKNIQADKYTEQMFHYIMPAFETVSDKVDLHQIKHTKTNAFYKEYEEAIKLAKLILKKFGYNISNTTTNKVSTPPFWIDMSKLFELYVLGLLYKGDFFGKASISYHDTYAGGKETDIIIKQEPYKCVIDCKYKPRYHEGTIDLADKRQLAGYTRLKEVYEDLKEPYHKIIKGLIIYPHQSCPDSIAKEKLFNTHIDEYIDFYKLGVSLPVLNIAQG